MATTTNAPVAHLAVQLARLSLSSPGDVARALALLAQLGPHDAGALRCRGLLLLSRREDYAAALEALDAAAAAAAGTDDTLFERAYCLYRLQRTDDALRLMQSSTEHRCRVLEAQIRYRTADYASSAAIFADLAAASKAAADGDLEEHTANLYAALAQAQLVGEPVSTPALLHAAIPPAGECPTYEQEFNAACWDMAHGNLASAERRLEHAEALGRATLSADEADAELAPIRLQRAVVEHMRGRHDAAMAVYQEVLKRSPGDAQLLSVAANNMAAIKGARDLFDGQRKFRLATTAASQAKQSPAQRRAIAINRCLLLLHMRKFAECRRAAEQLLQHFPTATDAHTLLMASLLAHEKRPADGITLLETYGAGRSQPSLPVLLSAAQERVRQLSGTEMLLAGAGALEALPDAMRRRAGIVATTVALLERAGAAERAIAILDAAIAAWKHAALSDARPQLVQLQHESAAFKLRHGFARAAAADYEQLLSADRDDQRARLGYVEACAQFDPVRAEEAGRDLPIVDTSGIDVAALESAVRVVGKKPPRAAAATATIVTSDGQPEAALKRKRKRKARPRRLPKQYNPNIPPDPERWLPKRERSSYKAKMKRRHRDRDVSRGTQGSATGAASASTGTSASKAKSVPQAT